MQQNTEQWQRNTLPAGNGTSSPPTLDRRNGRKLESPSAAQRWANRRRKSKADRLPSGTIWPNGEFTLGFPRKDITEDPGEVSLAGFGGDTSALREAIGGLVRDSQDSLGSSLVPNHHKVDKRPKSYGGMGITGYGKRMVRNGCHVLQSSAPPGCLSFLTLTLPSLPQNELLLLARDWGQVTRPFLQWLTRRLQGLGLTGEYASVTEVQGKRFEQRNELALHLHVVFQGRSRRGVAWGISPSEVRKAWLRVISKRLGREVSSCAVENIQAVRKSAAGYLGKYATKGSKQAAEVASQHGAEFLPGQWWNMSSSLKSKVKRACKKGDKAGLVLESIVQAYFAGPDLGFPGYLVCHQVDAPGGPITVGYSGRLDAALYRETLALFWGST